MKSFVYKLYCKDENIKEVYIGSSKRCFSKRYGDHKYNCNTFDCPKYNCYKYLVNKIIMQQELSYPTDYNSEVKASTAELYKSVSKIISCLK